MRDDLLASEVGQEKSSERVLCEPGRQKEANVLCQGELGAFWRKGPLLTIQAQGRSKLIQI